MSYRKHHAHYHLGPCNQFFMNTLETRIGLALQSKVSFLLIISILLWSMGVPALLNHAKAAQLTSVSDTLSTSNLTTNAKHSIAFVATNAIMTGQTIKVGLDPATNNFVEAFSAATSSDIYLGTSTATGYAVVTSCTSGNQATAVGNYNNGSDENLTFTICGASPNIIATGTPVQIIVGSTTRLWTNPSVAGSYRITLGGTNPNIGETRVAILPTVVVTASVNTSFTFTVSGLATSSSVGAITTTASSTATSLPFSTLASSTGAVIIGQTLQASTNARNGFSVTVQEDQPPTSSTGATIDLFANGATTSTPIACVAPSAQLDVPSTYGHFGVTSDDTDENSTGANEFGNATLWAGNIDQPRVLFSHSGPADGATQNKGLVHVAYKIQVSDLQEAGADYTNTLTYVATPTF